MPYTLADLRGQVRDKAGLDAADAQATDAILTSLINSALRTMAVEERWDWHKAEEIIALVPGTGDYARASDCRTTDRLVLSVGGRSWPLKLVTPPQFERYRSDADGYPRAFTVERGRLFVAPAPSVDGTLRHVYWATETTLVADGDTAKVPDWAIDLVVIRAAKAVAARLDNTSLQRLLKDEERTIMESLSDDATRARPPLELDRRRDWRL